MNDRPTHNHRLADYAVIHRTRATRREIDYGEHITLPYTQGDPATLEQAMREVIARQGRMRRWMRRLRARLCDDVEWAGVVGTIAGWELGRWLLGWPL